MKYEVTVIRGGKTETIPVDDVHSESEAKEKAVAMMEYVTKENGWTVHSTKLV